MRIFEIFSPLLEKRAAKKAVETLEQREARIAKNFSIKSTLSEGEGEVYRQIYSMREAIANYAKAHNVKVDVVEKNHTENPDSLIEVNFFDNDTMKSYFTRPSEVELTVTNLNKDNPKSSQLSIFGDIDKIYTEANNKLPSKVGKYNVHSETQDNFLRHFFRTIEGLVNSLQ